MTRHGLSDEEWDVAVERLVQSAVDQGFERECDDPAVMAQIADVLRAHERDQIRPARRGAA